MTTPRAVKSAEEEEEEIIKELCSSNGIALNRIGVEGPACARLESFFSGYPHICGLYHFPYLQKLCIIGQAVSKIDGLIDVPRLSELWIAECNLTKIEGLNEVPGLEKLFLYSNQISKIENLEHLPDLRTLFLNDNEIKIIEGLTNMKSLKELNLAENEIQKIGTSLNSLTQLESLELSGNNICSFKDLTPLVRLFNLTELGLKSPNYSSNPVGLLCNYATHVQYHLPHLRRLDATDVSAPAVQDTAESTVLKKKMFYNMRMKTMRRNLNETVSKLSELQDAALSVYQDKIRRLSFAIKEIERETRDMQGGEDGEIHASETESEKDAREAKAEEDKNSLNGFKTKKKALKERTRKWEKKCSELEGYFKEGMEQRNQAAEKGIHKLVTELETGGNVRFEEGQNSDVWYTSCHDLILSRFCGQDYKELGIQGIKIHKITRVHNRILRTVFDEKLISMTEEDDNNIPGSAGYYPNSRNSSYKRYLEYLFFIWDPELPGNQSEFRRILEEGFWDPETYQLGREPAVPLTNSLYIADKLRMNHMKNSKGKDGGDPVPFRFGQIIVTKSYIGKCVQYNETKQGVGKKWYPKADSVYRPRKDNFSGEDKNKSKCECTNRQSEWFVFDNEMVMPEYVIDFEYVTRLPSKSPYSSSFDSALEVKEKMTHVSREESSDDGDVLLLKPRIKSRPRLIALSEELLGKLGNSTTLNNITVLDLHGNSLTKLRYIQSLLSLKHLVVSFNELTKLDDIAQMDIEYLDASFNKICTLDGMKNMNRLKCMDLSWNRLQNTREDVSILRKHAPALSVLDLRHNSWQKPEGLRLRAIGRIKSLTKLDGIPVDENEAAAALRMAAGSRISQVSLLAHSRTDLVQPRTLSLSSNAQILTLSNRNKPDRLGEQDNVWYSKEIATFDESKVTTLNLDSQHISKLSNLERLENLRWASFNDNDITKIEGLEACHNLEDLSLEHNCITKIEGLSRQTKLKRLSLGHNYINSLENCSLERLVDMHYLSIENNKLTSLAGIQKCLALMELYIGNNKLTNIREIFYVKSLANLVILDLYGNEIANTVENYRLFIIYHLKTLKAVDGSAIDPSEVTLAREAFGGKLTQDYIAEKFGHAHFSGVKELDFPNASLRSADLGDGQLFVNLRSVNLEHNNMTSFSGLIYLVNLRVLCMNHNHVECIIPRPKQPSSNVKGKGGGPSITPASLTSIFSTDNGAPLLDNLEVLHLGYNGIKDLAALQLNRLTSLKALFLQGNDIAKVEGIEALQDLRELVLDRNKIKNLTEYSFVNQWNLQELHMEENRIKELDHFGAIENLQRLYLGSNRIQDAAELEKLEPLTNLVELSVVSNIVSRRLLHRPMLVFRMPQIMVIDGIPVSDEERAKAELYFMEQQVQPTSFAAAVETSLPGIGQYKTHVPVKVTNVQLMQGPYYDRTFGGTLHLTDDANHANHQDFQRGGGRRKMPQNRGDVSHGSSNSTINSGSVKMSYQHNGSRSQHQLGQVPYYQNRDNGEYGSHSDSLSKLGKSSRR